jgi:hypothetical protein
MNAGTFADELSALELVYGSESVEFSAETRTLRVHLPSSSSPFGLTLTCHVPDGYPEKVSLSCSDLRLTADWLPAPKLESMLRSVCADLDLHGSRRADALEQQAGVICSIASVLYESRQSVLHDEQLQCTQHWDTSTQGVVSDPGYTESAPLDRPQSESPERNKPENRQKRTSSNVPASELVTGITASIPDSQRATACEQDVTSPGPSEVVRLVSSEPITERKSTFQGHAARIMSSSAAVLCLQSLRQHRKGRQATHMSWAFRIMGDDQRVHEDYCDDGEQRAGRVVLELLRSMNQHNIFICVCRWFGGVLLHERRFHCIQLAAKRAVLALLETERAAPSLVASRQ